MNLTTKNTDLFHTKDILEELPCILLDSNIKKEIRNRQLIITAERTLYLLIIFLITRRLVIISILSFI